MSSPTSATHPYTYQKPSTMATRSLVSHHKPTEAPSASSSDHDKVTNTTQPAPLQRRTTNNYEQALASTQSTSTSAEDATSRPPFDRVQSFNKNDLKREVMQQTLPGASAVEGHGYHSTATAAQ